MPVSKETLPSLDLSSATHSEHSSESDNESGKEPSKKVPKTSHRPATLNLICDAIKQYNEKEGSSVQVIRKFIEAQNGQKLSNLILKKAFEKGLRDGLFVRQDHKETASLTGRYKMATKGAPKSKKAKEETSNETKQKKEAKEKTESKEKNVEKATEEHAKPVSKAKPTTSSSTDENAGPSKVPKKTTKAPTKEKDSTAKTKDTTAKPVTKPSGGKGKKAAVGAVIPGSTSDSEAQANPTGKAKAGVRRRRSKSESEVLPKKDQTAVKKAARGVKAAGKVLAGEKRNPRI